MLNEHTIKTDDYATTRTLLMVALDKVTSRPEIDPATDAMAQMRPSDYRLLLHIPAQVVTISQLARSVRISRQAVHASIARLASKDFVQIEPAPGSRRDKIVVITPLGQTMRSTAAEQQTVIEAEIETCIGAEKTAQLRAILLELIEGRKVKTKALA